MARMILKEPQINSPIVGHAGIIKLQTFDIRINGELREVKLI